MALGFASESDAFAHFFAVFCAVSLECAVIECVADFLHEVVVEPQIVHDEQPLRQHFTALEQVAQKGFTYDQILKFYFTGIEIAE